MKILITCPNLKLLGGVANHYIGLRPYWAENVKYQEIGKRSNKNGNGKYWLPWDIIIFLKNLFVFRPDCILFNPSIGSSALRRDFLLQRIAKFFRFNTAIFIHGFDLKNFGRINHKWMKENFNRTSCVFVLAHDFKKRLQKIGVTAPILLATTKVDDRMIENFDVKLRDGKSGNLLFLARVEKTKGIYETLEVFKILKKDYPQIKLQIVGDGSELNNVVRKVKNDNIKDIIISGKLSGKDLVEAYKSALLLLLLSSHGEGMPTTVLEAMAFGLPVITRPAGGLVDFFENDKMGFIDETLDPDMIANGVRPYLDNPRKIKDTAIYNHEYAKRHFMASKVAAFIECSLKNIIKTQ